MTLKELLDYTENYKSEIRSLEFNIQDVRYSFFGLMYSNLHYYYIGKVNYKLFEHIGNKNIEFKSQIFDFAEHVISLYDIQKNEVLSYGYKGNLDRYIFSNSWTTFEHSVSLIFDFVIDSKERENIILDMNNNIKKKIFPKLTDEDKKILLDELKKSSFIPLGRKFNYITKRNEECYIGDLKEDREFIIFIGKIRNSLLHSNGLYKRNDYSYTFNGVNFKFKDGEIFQQNYTKNDFLYFELSVRIISIFKSLINCVADIVLIKSPGH